MKSWMNCEDEIKRFQQQIRQRMELLAQQDPVCNRLGGRIEVLRQVMQEMQENSEKKA